MNDARDTLATALAVPLVHKPEAITHMLNAYAAWVANEVATSETAAARGIIAEQAAQLEQARGIAVQLENEVARLTDELAAVRPDRAEVLRDVADDVVAYCPDHGDRDTARMDCHCDIATELRKAAREAAPKATA